MTGATVVPSQDHERLRLDLMAAGRAALIPAADAPDFVQALTGLVTYCFEQLLPHLDRDELRLTEAAECPETRLLATAMRAEARALTAAAYELAEARDRCEAVAAARLVHALLAAHINHEEVLATALGDPNNDHREAHDREATGPKAHAPRDGAGSAW